MVFRFCTLMLSVFGLLSLLLYFPLRHVQLLPIRAPIPRSRLAPRSRICQKLAHSLVLSYEVGDELAVPLPITFHLRDLTLQLLIGILNRLDLVLLAFVF